MDLIATIEEDAEVENLSEDSDAEVEVQRTSHLKCGHDFNIRLNNFPFSTNRQNSSKGKLLSLKRDSNLFLQ